jgi:hypothetical protein
MSILQNISKLWAPGEVPPPAASPSPEITRGHRPASTARATARAEIQEMTRIRGDHDHHHGEPLLAAQLETVEALERLEVLLTELLAAIKAAK